MRLAVSYGFLKFPKIWGYVSYKHVSYKKKKGVFESCLGKKQKKTGSIRLAALKKQQVKIIRFNINVWVYDFYYVF